jgi:Lrp/AsnC family leucine-responsive transcriptional regulator
VKTSQLDAVDRVILAELVRDGRATYARLGTLAGLSPHAVAPRVRRLVEAGIITGFTATVAYGALGRGFEALIDIRLLPTTDPNAFEAAVSGIESIQWLAFVTGRFDYQLRVACIDADDLGDTIRLLRHAGAAITETHVLLRHRNYAHAIRRDASISDEHSHVPTI